VKVTKKCPKCERDRNGPGKVIHVAQVDDVSQGYVASALTHKGWFLGGERRGFLEAYVCNECGYVEFYVKDFPIPSDFHQES
jgi:predicted nucleic-acid-binding Zn-ribbon protein